MNEANAQHLVVTQEHILCRRESCKKKIHVGNGVSKLDKYITLSLEVPCTLTEYQYSYPSVSSLSPPGSACYFLLLMMTQLKPQT